MDERFAVPDWDPLKDESFEEEMKTQPEPPIKYPNITVKLTGEDGNAFAILGRMNKALRRAGLPEEEVKKFQGEATSGDYDNLLMTCMNWVNVK